MKKLQKAALCLTLALTMAAGSLTAFAATYKTPAEAAAALSQKSAEEVQSLREAGKSYGSIAADAGKLSEFQAAMRELQKEALDARVASGSITQEQADAALKAMEDHHATCDGTGTGVGCSVGLGCGSGAGHSKETGHRSGHGMGHGRGSGCRR